MGMASSVARPEKQPATITSDAELLDQLLFYVEQRRNDAHRRLEDVARRRTMVSGPERALARAALRTEAAEIRSELARLNLACSLIRTLLQPRDTGAARGRARRRAGCDG
jgi:hypothetical protein